MSEILQLKITLKGSKPPIWRRVLVEKNTKLDDLHRVIQVAMGWYNCHLWEFNLGIKSFGPVDKEGLMGFTLDEMGDAAKQNLARWQGKKKQN